jgi:hypothetical protein
MNIVRCMTLGLAIAITLLLSGTASAQYGGGPMGSPGMGGGSTTPSYGSGGGKAIGIGIGAAAAGAGVLYLVQHHRGSVDGCVRQGSNDQLNLIDSKTGKTYSLVLGSADVKPGEEVRLDGKKTKDAAGNSTFEVSRIEKDLGACR